MVWYLNNDWRILSGDFIRRLFFGQFFRLASRKFKSRTVYNYASAPLVSTTYTVYVIPTISTLDGVASVFIKIGLKVGVEKEFSFANGFIYGEYHEM